MILKGDIFNKLIRRLQINEPAQSIYMVLAADLRERSAEDSENSANSSDSEVCEGNCQKCRHSRQCQIVKWRQYSAKDAVVAVDAVATSRFL
jgi:hypothetical protein